MPHAVLTGSVDREPPFGPSGLAMLPHQLAGHYRQHDLSQPHSLAVPFPLSETPFPNVPGWRTPTDSACAPHHQHYWKPHKLWIQVDVGHSPATDRCVNLGEVLCVSKPQRLHP